MFRFFTNKKLILTFSHKPEVGSQNPQTNNHKPQTNNHKPTAKIQMPSSRYIRVRDRPEFNQCVAICATGIRCSRHGLIVEGQEARCSAHYGIWLESTPEGRARLVDFWLARAREARAQTVQRANMILIFWPTPPISSSWRVCVRS